ncbi:MAG TPA: hypothetical protein VK400_16725, partial [Pyrinomonadaceae bacterium]|nr:hypothetical protein [Pyrinomonadaceae bacterium]
MNLTPPPLPTPRGEAAYRQLKETGQPGARAQAFKAAREKNDAREQPAATLTSAISPVSEVRKLWASDAN